MQGNALLKAQLQEIQVMINKVMPELERALDDEPDSDILNVNEVAELLGIAPVTVRRKLKDPCFPQPYLVKPLRFRRSAVTAFIVESEQAHKEQTELEMLQDRIASIQSRSRTKTKLR